MAVYLMRFSYTPETWSKLMHNPEDRLSPSSALLADSIAESTTHRAQGPAGRSNSVTPSL